MQENKVKKITKGQPGRERQKTPLPRGTNVFTYRNLLDETVLNRLGFLSKYVGFFIIGYMASCVNFLRMVELPYYQRFLENIIFAMCYFMARTDYVGFLMIIICGNLFWYFPAMNMSTMVNEYLFVQALCFTVCGSFRWFGCTVASIDIALNYLLVDYDEGTNLWCLGLLMSAMIGVYIIQQVPLGFEDVFWIFVVFCSVNYAEKKYMMLELTGVILMFAILWANCKHTRVRRGYVLVGP